MFKKISFIVFLFLLVLGGSLIASAQSASLFFFPASGNHSVGQTFIVYVKVNSGGSPGINAAEGVIKFDSSLLSVVGVSNQSSIFNLWTTQPTFSNSKGQITFGGGSPQPYMANSGTIFSITFKALKAGTAQVYFQSGSVLAADGKGTDVLSTKGKANFIIGGSAYKPTPTPSSSYKPTPTPYQSPSTSLGSLPPLPAIKSSTHPDSEKWYKDHNPKMSWDLPSDVTSVALLIGKKQYSQPTVVYTPPISTKDLKDLEDGVWYFHVRFKNDAGWGKTAHKKIKIDSTPPEKFSLKIKQDNQTDPLPVLIFKTKDNLSGVDYYEILVDNTSSSKISASEVSESGYKMVNPIKPGEHTITIKAVDRAGNFTVVSEKISVQALKDPKITNIPKKIKTSESLLMKGTSYYPDAVIRIYFEKDGKRFYQDTKTDKNGNWSFVYPGGLEKGNYSVWIKLIAKNGAESRESKKYKLKVSGVSIFAEFWWIIVFLLLITSLGSVGYIIYLKQTFENKQEKIKSNLLDLKETVKKVFMALREELEEDIVLADKKKGLSKSEAEVRDKLREAIDVSEELIKKDFKSVEKELK